MRTVIIDTSIWIDFFRGKLDSHTHKSLTNLIDIDRVAITDIIQHEILVGAKNQTEYDYLKDILSPLEIFYLTREEIPLLNEFGFSLKTKGLLGKYTDVAISYLSRSHDAEVFSFDEYFNKLAKKKIIKLFSI